MHGILQDVRYALRMMRKAPVVSGVAVLSLAVAIAANTTVFSVFDAFLLSPFPWDDPDRLVLLWQNNRNDPGERPVRGADLLEWREEADAFQGIAAWSTGLVNLTGGDRPAQVKEARTTPNTFELLGGRMALGRGFRADDAGDAVVILDPELWETRFGADPGVVGRSIQVDGRPLTVVGVLGDGFDLYPADLDLYRPLDLARYREDRQLGAVGFAVARLAPGVPRSRARQELEAVARRQEERFPEANEGIGVLVQTLSETFPGPTDTRLMWVLLTVTGFLLLIACANVANLMLARAEARQREIGVRTALGGGRGRILRQLLTESVVLAAVAAALGVPLGVWGVTVARDAMPPQIPAGFMPELDGSVLAFTVAVTALAGLAFGLAPALHAVSGDLRDALTAGSRGGTAGRRRRRLRNGFVVAEMALSLGLLVGAGMLISTMDDFMNRDPGFVDRNLLTFRITLPDERYPDHTSLARFYRETTRTLASAEGVREVALMSYLPRSRAYESATFTVEGRPHPGRNREPSAMVSRVGAGWFDRMGVPVERGRGLEERDRADAAPVAVVNRTFVRRHFPDGDPLGERLVLEGESRTIVGVAGDVLHTRLIPEEGASAVVYLPLAQTPIRALDVAVRAASDEPAGLTGPVRRGMAEVDPELPLAAVETYRSHLEQELSGPQVIGRLLAIFGVVALLLAAVGIYGVIAHSVTRRTREIGIRMALGAGAGRVVRSITAEGLRLAGLGLLLGVPLAWALGKAITSGIVGVGAPTVRVVAVLVATLTATAVLASWLPARRAAGVEPARALGEE